MINKNIVFKTGNNIYLLNKDDKNIMLIHPILSWIYENFDGDIENTYKNFMKIKEQFDCQDEDYFYYLKKYLFLKNHNIITENKKKYDVNMKLDPEKIKFTLANLKQITFEVTDKCNLQCEYCGYGKFYNDYDERENKNLDINIAKNFLIYLKKLWSSNMNCNLYDNVYISFYGGGPLLNFDFIKEIVEFVKTLKIVNRNIRYSMTTNGIFLNKYIDFLVENNFSLLVSLDGDSKGNSYRVTSKGSPSYETIVNNVNMIKEKHPKYFSECVNFNAVLNNRNSVESLYHYFKDNFDKNPMIGEINNSGVIEHKREEFNKMYVNARNDLDKSTNKELIMKDMFIGLSDIKNLLSFIMQYGSCNKYGKGINHKCCPTGTCLPFDRRVFVTVNGKILPCERIAHKYALGEIEGDEIFLDFNQISKIYQKYYKKIFRQCKNCYMINTCQQCMFQLDLDKDFQCQGFMDEAQFKNFLAYNMEELENNTKTYTRIINEVHFE